MIDTNSLYTSIQWRRIYITIVSVFFFLYFSFVTTNIMILRLYKYSRYLLISIQKPIYVQEIEKKLMLFDLKRA